MNKLNFSSSFSVGNFFMLRSPLFPLQSFIELNKKLNSLHDNELLFIDDLIIELKNNRIFMESILISSKNLYKALINFNSETNKKKKKQIFSSVIKYINRISTRSTPFGINAGFVMGEFSDSSSLNIGEIESHSTRIRPDMEWLLGVVKILDENILYLKNINVQTNNMIYKKYNKVHLPYVTSYGQKKEGKYSLEGNTISQNPLILFILEELKVRMSLETIAHKVRDEFEGAELENIYGLLVELIKAEYILTELRPQLTAAHPLDNLIKVLSGCNPPTSSVPGQIYKTLVDLELLMRKYDKLSIGQGIELLEEIEILMKSLLDHGNDYYQIDLRINEKAPMKLNEQLKEDILIAADILERLHTSNNSFSHLELYREEFIDLYGEKSEVPLLELLDEDIGLGAPLTYEYPVSKKRSRFPAANKNKVNPILIDLFNKAVFSNEFEINLTDKDIMKFNEDFQPKKPLSLELTFSIMANSESHVDSGDYKLIMFGGGHLGSNGAGNSIGRFYDMLPQKYKKDIKKLGQIVESRIDEKEVLISEIVYNPRKGKSTNLVITPNIHNYEISLGTIGSKESKNIPLDDILVGCTDEGFYLRSKKHNKRIKALKLNVLNPSFASHNIYRFLYEVGMENEIIERDINWGPYNYMLYTPRVTYKNIVILQAKWRINNAVLDLDNKNNNFKIWKTGFLKWKEKLSLPRFVYLAETDNRLLLDLEEDLSLLILHRRLRQITTDKLTLVEYGSEQLKSPISNKNSIFQGEFIVSLIRNEKINKFNNVLLKDLKNYPVRRVYLPGSEWLYLKIYIGNTVQDEFLVNYLFPLISELNNENLFERYFFIRYLDPEPHIRLRFKGKPNVLISDLLKVISLQFERLQERGIINQVVIDTYKPELERYGGIEYQELFESWFNMDSHTILLLRSKSMNTLLLEDFAILSILDILEKSKISLNKQLEYFDSVVSYKEYRKEFREEKRPLLEYIHNKKEHSNSQYFTQVYKISNEIFNFRKVVLMDYLDSLTNSSCLHNGYFNIINSLIHMHLNRLFGTDRRKELKLLTMVRHSIGYRIGVLRNMNMKEEVNR